MNRNDSIAVFDSGLGGISVLRELKKQLPAENYIYYGDSLNAPYGQKTAEEIRKLSENVIRSLLSEENLKAVVIACNTATSAAEEYLQKVFSAEIPGLPFIGIEPAVEWAAESLSHPHILTLATNFTIHGERFLKKVESLQQKAEFTSLGVPFFVTAVENGVNDQTMTEECVREMDQLFSEVSEPVDAVVLGCTHFPFLKDTVRREVQRICGGKAEIFDAAVLVAQKTKEFLYGNDLMTDRTEEGTIRFLNSDPSKQELMRKLYES